MGKKIIIFTVCMLLLAVPSLWAAVGCTLNDPDRDVKRIFPQSTGYKTEFITIKERGGKELAAEIEEKLEDKLEPVYETLDVPYAFYTVLKGKEKIGYIHGVNQKGMFGGMQLILATNLDGEIINFYFQKISSPEAKRFRNKEFTDQFAGLTLTDFYQSSAQLNEIQDPSEKSRDDFKNTLRGIKKNLILFDEFKLDNKYDVAYQKAAGA